MSDTLSAIVSSDRSRRRVSGLFLGLAGDAPRTPGARISLRGIDQVEIGRGTTRTCSRQTTGGVDVLTLALADARMSGQHARLSRVGTTWAIDDLGSKNGTWIDGERVQRKPLADGSVIVVGHSAIVFRTSGGEADDTEAAPEVAPGLATLSPALATQLAELARAARARVPVEITGESGTGKELVARAIHALSDREGPFVAVNCGALAATLVEAELFGHRKGAYTGAAGERAGLVRSADGGTLFLDEIGELPATAQAALLRVLQEGEVQVIGSDRPVKVDLRVVTATHRDLDADVATGRFRADLRARLLGASIALPALRDRREDLGLIVRTLLDRLAPGRRVAFSADAVMALYRHAWPLNIRELERALAAALAIANERIELHHLPAAVRREPVIAPPDGEPTVRTDDELALREALTASIARHQGNLAAVARELGKDRTQIRRWMKRFGLSRDGA